MLAAEGYAHRVLSRRIRSGPTAPFVLPAALFMVVFAGYPLFEMVRMSVSKVGFENLLGHWAYVGAKNFTDLFAAPDFSSALKHTLIFVAVVVAVAMVGGMEAALLIQRSTRGTRFVQALLLFSWMLPPVVSGSVWKFLFASNGALNGIFHVFGVKPVLWLVEPGLVLYAVAFVNAWAALPFAAIVLKAGLLGIPRDTQEAGAVDGARSWRVFWQITLPQLLPIVLVLTVIITVYAFRSFDFLFVMTQGGPGTASTTLPYLAYRDAFVIGFFGQGAAAAMVSGLCVAAAALFYVRLTRRAEARA